MDHRVSPRLRLASLAGRGGPVMTKEGRLTPCSRDGVVAFMSNENPPPPKKKRAPAGYFDILRWSGLPGFWVYLIGSIVLTAAVAIGGAWLLVRMGVQ